jgi:hypothetical protein
VASTERVPVQFSPGFLDKSLDGWLYDLKVKAEAVSQQRNR